MRQYLVTEYDEGGNPNVHFLVNLKEDLEAPPFDNAETMWKLFNSIPYPGRDPNATRVAYGVTLLAAAYHDPHILVTGGKDVPTPAVKRRTTDKERLDWIENTWSTLDGTGMSGVAPQWCVIESMPVDRGVGDVLASSMHMREAIDRAIAVEDGKARTAAGEPPAPEAAPEPVQAAPTVPERKIPLHRRIWYCAQKLVSPPIHVIRAQAEDGEPEVSMFSLRAGSDNVLLKNGELSQVIANFVEAHNIQENRRRKGEARAAKKKDCDCIDCGGSKPDHDPDCEHMNELHPQSEAVAPNAPRTVQEVVDQKFAALTQDEIEYIKSHDSVSVHFTSGMSMRNNLGLWRDSPIRHDAVEKYGIAHADDISGLVMDWLWAKVRGEEFDPVARCQSFHKHWEREGTDALDAANWTTIGVGDQVLVDPDDKNPDLKHGFSGRVIEIRESGDAPLRYQYVVRDMEDDCFQVEREEIILEC